MFIQLSLDSVWQCGIEYENNGFHVIPCVHKKEKTGALWGVFKRNYFDKFRLFLQTFCDRNVQHDSLYRFICRL